MPKALRNTLLSARDLLVTAGPFLAIALILLILAYFALDPNPLTLDTGIDDLGFVHAILRREPIADTDRLALYTFSATSLDALQWHMRDMQADALVFVEGWERVRFGADLVRECVD